MSESAEMARATQLDEQLALAFARPSDRPLAVRGRSGSGKTTLLRRAAARSHAETVWISALDLVHGLTAAMREERLGSYCKTLTEDERALCIEHLEDLRGKPCTRAEVERVLRLAAPRRPILLTLTHAKGDREVVRWVRSWTTLVSHRGRLPSNRNP